MNKEEILKKAAELISDKRQETHGDCFKNHSQIADLWSVFLDDKLKTFKEITPGDVAIMMCLLKISRSTMGDFNMDDFVDGAAYMAIAGEMNDVGSIPEKSRGEIMGEITKKRIMELNKENK